MGTSLNERELVATLAEALNRIHRGERFVVERDGTRPAILMPPDQAMASGIAGPELATRIGKHRMPGDGFVDDLESARSAMFPAYGRKSSLQDDMASRRR